MTTLRPHEPGAPGNVFSRTHQENHRSKKVTPHHDISNKGAWTEQAPQRSLFFSVSRGPQSHEKNVTNRLQTIKAFIHAVGVYFRLQNCPQNSGLQTFKPKLRKNRVPGTL